MNKPTNAVEMRELLLDYIDVLLLGGIPKVELDPPKEEADIEKTAVELAELAKKVESLHTDEYRLLLDGISILYGENRGTATERCYALFWQVQQMQSVSGQLEKCFGMLRMLDYVTNKTRMSLWPSAALGI